MKIREILKHLESKAPLSFQEEYDNSGLISGNIDTECTGVLVSLDCTEEVVEEARNKKCNLIISHHPLIFRPLSRISPEFEAGRALMSAISSEIILYAIHTNLDNVISGVNATIADKLGMINRKILLPRANQPDAGSGLIGDLKKTLKEVELLEILKERFMVPVVRHSALTGKPVNRLALCGGAGSFLISSALREGADVFISADIKYHEFFGGEGRMVIMDIGHFESEQFTIDLLHDVILEKFTNFAVLKSGTRTNPVKYYI